MITHNNKPLAKTPLRYLVLTSIITFIALLFPGVGSAEPFRPTAPGQILERLPAQSDAVSRELGRLRADLNKDPNNLDLARRLARRYIDLGRAEADPRYYGYAEAALKPWIGLNQPPVDVRVLRAVLRQNRHAFDAALDDLSHVIAASPRNAQALLTQAFILQVQGRYGAARESCRRLPRGINPLVVATCVARIESLTGRAGTAYGLLQRGLATWRDADPRLRLWALTNLGEIAQRNGDGAAAEMHYREALDLGLRDAYLRGAYADLLLDQDRAPEVRDLLADDIRIDAQLLRLAIAEARLGNAAASDHRNALAARFADSRLRGSVIHRREEARFALQVLNKPDEALRLALANWQVQREPWDARLVLAAALAAGAPDQARPVVAWLEETGLEDPIIRPLMQRVSASLKPEQG